MHKYPNEQHRIKRSNLRWSKISLWKDRGSSEGHEQKVKTQMRNKIGNADKKTISKNAYTERELYIQTKRGESPTIRTKNTTRRD